MKKQVSQSGFTLIEIVMTLSVLAMIAAITSMAFSGTSAAEANLRNSTHINETVFQVSALLSDPDACRLYFNDARLPAEGVRIPINNLNALDRSGGSLVLTNDQLYQVGQRLGVQGDLSIAEMYLEVNTIIKSSDSVVAVNNIQADEVEGEGAGEDQLALAPVSSGKLNQHLFMADFVMGFASPSAYGPNTNVYRRVPVFGSVRERGRDARRHISDCSVRSTQTENDNFTAAFQCKLLHGNSYFLDRRDNVCKNIYSNRCSIGERTTAHCRGSIEANMRGFGTPGQAGYRPITLPLPEQPSPSQCNFTIDPVMTVVDTREVAYEGGQFSLRPPARVCMKRAEISEWTVQCVPPTNSTLDPSSLCEACCRYDIEAESLLGLPL